MGPMTNGEYWMYLFLKQHPEYEGRNLGMNLCGDVLDLDVPERDPRRIIAVSNAEHNIEHREAYINSIPTKWTLRR